LKRNQAPGVEKESRLHNRAWNKNRKLWGVTANGEEMELRAGKGQNGLGATRSQTMKTRGGGRDSMLITPWETNKETETLGLKEGRHWAESRGGVGRPAEAWKGACEKKQKELDAGRNASGEAIVLEGRKSGNWIWIKPPGHWRQTGNTEELEKRRKNNTEEKGSKRGNGRKKCGHRDTQGRGPKKGVVKIPRTGEMRTIRHSSSSADEK